MKGKIMAPHLSQLAITLSVVIGGTSFLTLYIIQEIWTTRNRKDK